MPIKFVTSNQNKLKEAREILGVPVDNVGLELREIQSIQVVEVSEEKARLAYGKVGGPVVVEDTGLYLKSLDGFPGALVKWVVGPMGNEGFCKFVDGLPDRSAWTETCVCMCDGGKLHTFVGRMDGKISESPRGGSGFGWDAIFQPNGHDKTLAEMTMDEKNVISHRSQAFRKLKAHLEK